MSGREYLSREADQPFDEWLTDVLGRIKGEKLDITAIVYEQIVAEEDPLSAFQYFLKNADDIVSTEELEIPPRYNAEEIQNLRRKCTSFVKGILNGALVRNCTEKEFYSLLWHSISNDDPILSEKDEVIYAIYLIWRDGRIPYYQLEDGLRMSNEEFQEISRNNMRLIRKAFFIIHSSLKQRTERSTLLLKVLDDCKTEEDRIVVFAQILGKLEQRAVDEMFSRLRKN